MVRKSNEIDAKLNIRPSQKHHQHHHRSKGLERILKINQHLFGDDPGKGHYGHHNYHHYHHHQYGHPYYQYRSSLINDNRKQSMLSSNTATNENGSKNVTYLIIHHVLRLVVLIVCIIGCMVQIISIVNIFFGYPAIVFVDIHQMDRLMLPGITICNNNRVMRSKLNAYDAKFAYKWNVLMNRTSNNHQFKLYQQRLIDNLIRSMLANLTVSEFMSFGSTADNFLDVDFFRCASDKNHPDKKCIYLSNLFTTAQEHGNCFTLFHKSSSSELESIAIESGLSESAVVRGLNNESVDIEMSMKPFAPNEIIRFRVNFDENEYTTLNEPISGRFIIHDNNQIAVMREKSYRIKPGKYYIFYISKYTDRLLPAPYVTDCRDYDQKFNRIIENINKDNSSSGGNVTFSLNNYNNIIIDNGEDDDEDNLIENTINENSDDQDRGSNGTSTNDQQQQQSKNNTNNDKGNNKGTNKGNNDNNNNDNQSNEDSKIKIESKNLLFRAPTSKANCIIGCMALNTIMTCNCWPPELPFLFNQQTNATENQLKWCDWRQKPPLFQQKTQSSLNEKSKISNKLSNETWFQYCFNRHEDQCNQHCKADCRIDRYRIVSEEIEWPSKERIEHTDDNDLRRLKQCCAVISIRYWSAEQKINQYKPRFEIAEFTSNIGGLLSMWLGFSLFGFYNLIEKFFTRLWRYCFARNRKQTDNADPAANNGHGTHKKIDTDSSKSILDHYDEQRNQTKIKTIDDRSKDNGLISREINQPVPATLMTKAKHRKSLANNSNSNNSNSSSYYYQSNDDYDYDYHQTNHTMTKRRIPLTKRRIFQNVIYNNNYPQHHHDFNNNNNGNHKQKVIDYSE